SDRIPLTRLFLEATSWAFRGKRSSRFRITRRMSCVAWGWSRIRGRSRSWRGTAAVAAELQPAGGEIHGRGDSGAGRGALAAAVFGALAGAFGTAIEAAVSAAHELLQ